MVFGPRGLLVVGAKVPGSHMFRVGVPAAKVAVLEDEFEASVL
jgi:hypothetical protein